MPASRLSAITKGTILNLSSNADVYERGERYYRDGKLLSYQATEDTDGTTQVRASVEGNYKNYEVSLKLDGVGALSGYACSCESHSIWRGACKHVVAVLFVCAEGHTRIFSSEKMRLHAQDLTNNLEKIIYSGIDESFSLPVREDDKALLKLAPELHCGPRGAFLSFTVGRGRMYVVKSIAGFVKSCKAGETVVYGQGLAFAHRRELFDETSRRLIDFITREDALYAEVGKRLSRQFQFTHHPLFAAREMHLAPRNADEFFEIVKDLPIECTSDFVNVVALKNAYPAFGLSVRHLPDSTTIKAKDFPYSVICGEAYHYILCGSGLFRMPISDGRLLVALFKAFEETPSREILFSSDEQQRFLTVVLPRLLKMGVVEDIEGKPPEGEISPLLAKMYFDADGKDVIGRLEFHYGENLAPIRDIVGEYALKRRLEAAGFFECKEIASQFRSSATETHDASFVPEKNYFRLKGNDMVYGFLHGIGGIESLRDCAEVYVSEDLQKKTIKAGAPQLGLRLSGDLLKVTLEDAGYEIGELLEALEAYRARKKFFRLKDGRFISLDDEAVTAAAGFLDALDVSKNEMRGKSLTIPAYRALYVDELTTAGDLAATHALKRDAGFEKLLAHFKDKDALGFAAPPSLDGILREYQKTGYAWLKTLAHYGFGGILADDMGLGKTLQIIAVILSENKTRNEKSGVGDASLPSLVVAPTSLMYNWENEIKRFAPELVTQVVSGFPDKRHELLKTPDVNVFITTYDMLKRDIEHYLGMEFNYIVADEAQNIKNPSTQAAKSVKQLCGRVRFALTGTPIENTLTELWSIFDFIMPGYLYTAAKFSRMYEVPIIKHNDGAAAANLRRQIAPFVMRRVKKNVLKELPDKTETTLPAELLPEQKVLYQAHLMEAIGAFDEIIAKNTFSDNRMRILAQLTRLRQICCHPSLFLEDYKSGSGKLALTLETIQLALDAGRRVLLFSQFTRMLGLMKDALASSEILNRRGEAVSYFYLDGATKAKERVEMTEAFNAGQRDLFLISLKAGGTGLNLTGADVVIHYDPWWNPSVMDQAADRAHRYGQEKAVQVFNIVAKDSIEEKIMALQEKKRGLIDSVITESGSFINLLSEEEVRKLFS